MPRIAKSRVVSRNRKTHRKKPTRRVSIKNKEKYYKRINSVLFSRVIAA